MQKIDLRKVPLEELIEAIIQRPNVRTIPLADGEGYKIIASGPNGLHERYLREYGKVALVIEVNGR